jgi:H+/Cl- antiporter ClcA
VLPLAEAFDWLAAAPRGSYIIFATMSVLFSSFVASSIPLVVFGGRIKISDGDKDWRVVVLILVLFVGYVLAWGLITDVLMRWIYRAARVDSKDEGKRRARRRKSEGRQGRNDRR